MLGKFKIKVISKHKQIKINHQNKIDILYCWLNSISYMYVCYKYVYILTKKDIGYVKLNVIFELIVERVLSCSK